MPEAQGANCAVCSMKPERDKPYARRKYPQKPGGARFLCKALRRTARLAHFASLARRAAACLRERGAEALWREASFRISLMTKGEVWRFRADIPLRRELKAQRAGALFARMPLVSVVVPLYNTPPKFLREMMRSVLGQTLRRPGAGADGRIRRGPR